MIDPDPMTFDSLSALYRAETTSTNLSDARKDLYPALVRLLENSRKEYEAEYSKDPDSIMCEGKNERRKKAISYAQRVIDLRMDKIAKMAIRASMGAESPVDRLTSEERIYYDNVLAGSRKLRTTVIKDQKRYRTPDISEGVMSEGRITERVIVTAAQPEPEETMIPEVTDVALEAVEDPLPADEGPKEERLMIRILEDLPRLAGPDCDYDLKKEEVVWMPAVLAQALINHKKAVLMNVTP